MDKKLKQVTDSIHGTIYLSYMESELISTPYFYRLHDIYQSSTVYMTFPSNRTKRYEHSLGTMKLASQILFSSVTNATPETRDKLFKKLKLYYEQIVETVSNGDDENLYFSKCSEKIEQLFDTIENENINSNFIDYIREAVKTGEFNDAALGYYQYYPTECITDVGSENIENVFLYRCLLQAVRIVALFHDVGHPPYSHIIEQVLKDLYNTVSSSEEFSWNAEKKEEFLKCLQPFFSNEKKVAFKSKRIFSDYSLIKAQPHERIGLGLLTYAINDVIPQKILATVNSSLPKHKIITRILYYITVVEFTFAILTENNQFFKSFHKIVDGIIDADRLDYIVRDSQNSGVDWGKIPYERVINSAKLFCLKKDNNGHPFKENEEVFVISYPQKISDDIEDLLLVRYKIFARINFHHRCMKTSVALQDAVRELAINYLTNEDEKCINPDISILWVALKKRLGNKTMRIIQWNDSWLISVLHKSMVILNTNGKIKNNLLKESLEEILLNKKKYYSLIKRGRDNCKFVKEILKKAKITPDMINKLKLQEYKKYYDNIDDESDMKELLTNPKREAMDSLLRLSDIFHTYELESLCKFIPLDGSSLKEIVEDSLKSCVNLTNASVIINEGRNKTGLPDHSDVLDGIYLYKNDHCFLFDENFSLRDQIISITKNIPWLYVYFIPKTGYLDIYKLNDELIDLLSTNVGDKLKKRFDELFNSKKLTIS